MFPPKFIHDNDLNSQNQIFWTLPIFPPCGKLEAFSLKCIPTLDEIISLPFALIDELSSHDNLQPMEREL